MAMSFFALVFHYFSLFVIFFFFCFGLVGDSFSFFFYVGLVWFARAEKESDVCRKERDDDGVRLYVAEMARVPTERVFVAEKKDDVYIKEKG
jgi:hypothetical protein